MFVDGFLNGYGEYTHTNGEKYTGYFKDNLRHGQGRLLMPAESNLMEFGPQFDIYEGTFEYGKLEGRGVIRYANGKTYEGEFKEGKKVGYG